MTAELRALLETLADYLGDRPQTDRAAMELYQRVMAMLGEQKP